MNNKGKTEQSDATKSSLIDRRYFLKASSAAVVAAAAVVAVGVADPNQVNPSKENSVEPEKPDKSKVHWQAGWMAF